MIKIRSVASNLHNNLLLAIKIFCGRRDLARRQPYIATTRPGTMARKIYRHGSAAALRSAFRSYSHYNQPTCTSVLCTKNELGLIFPSLWAASGNFASSRTALCGWSWRVRYDPAITKQRRWMLVGDEDGLRASAKEPRFACETSPFWEGAYGTKITQYSTRLRCFWPHVSQLAQTACKDVAICITWRTLETRRKVSATSAKMLGVSF